VFYSKLHNKSKTNRKSTADPQQVVRHRSISNHRPITNPQHLRGYTAYCMTFCQTNPQQIGVVEFGP